MVEKMDLSSEDALMCFPRLTLSDPEQGSLTTLMRKKWKTLYSMTLIMQE